ncbi:hypothetical protein A0H81_09818 [Grifola frondosa]|uniref:Major facilitator superfamily (MFS) profile domain-containing protein n=1 Tax=Grifola frondosa TaxID=5627 RepID=A0A1C7M092_GRIFR|nr:hypothetical protein A0H81_09818 [Grifola frondosa]
MASLPHSETSTIAVPEEAHASSPSQPKAQDAAPAEDASRQQHIAFTQGAHPVHPTYYPAGHRGDHLNLIRSHSSHRENRPDLSFPFDTTDTERGGFTNEYRTVSRTGFIPADLSLHPIPSHVSRIPTALQDPEKAAALRETKLVTWKEEDPEDPRNWSNLYRWYITAIAAISVVAVAFASAVVTGDFKDIRAQFDVGNVVVALSVSLMVVGFGIGPLAWSPLSELYGRRPIWIWPSLVYVIFNIPCALAQNIQTLLICRFLCGLFASAPLTLAGGTISDIWDNNERGFAIALFAAAPYGGPVLGPIVGGFIGETIGWRWILWVNMIFAGVVTAFCMTIPETFAPTLLRKRAERLREETGDPNIVTEQELTLLLLMSLYIALIYGLLYAFFFSFPVVFGEDYRWNDGMDYLRRAEEKGGRADPEDRLVGMMIGCWFVPISLFIFGWTSPPAVLPGGGNWVGPCSSGIPFGFGMVIIYFSANAYLIDAFPGYVASALAAKTVIRSGSGAAMPLFITAMYHNLGNGWAASTWAFISLAMIPIPFLFYRYGSAIRAKSKRAAA